MLFNFGKLRSANAANAALDEPVEHKGLLDALFEEDREPVSRQFDPMTVEMLGGGVPEEAAPFRTAPVESSPMAAEDLEPVVMESSVVLDAYEKAEPAPKTPGRVQSLPQRHQTAEIRDLRKPSIESIRSALGPGTLIEGKFSFDSPVRIDGILRGEVNSTSALIVGERASVQATIHVGSLVVLGEVSGEVEATESVEVKRGGYLVGDIVAQNMMIEEGGFFTGRCGQLH